jgi:hypothetical protein
MARANCLTSPHDSATLLYGISELREMAGPRRSVSTEGGNMAFPGGKSVSGLYQRIINAMPPHSIYIEPFLGDGAVMRRKKPAIHNIGIDLDADVLARWRGDEIDNLDLYCCDAIEWLKHSFGLLRFHPRPQVPKPRLFGVAEFRDATDPDETVQPCRDILLFADPPYPAATRKSRRPPYKHDLSDGRHSDLLSVLKRLSCYVMVSSYDSPLYRSELAEWRIIEVPVTNRANGRAVECLWMNFPEPTELHDYSFLGEEKRERERIRRRVNSWCRTLARLPILERKAIVDAITENNRGAARRPLSEEPTSESAAVCVYRHAERVHVDPTTEDSLPSSQAGIQLGGIRDQSTKAACPQPDEFVMPNLRWGRSDVLFTPAYWACQIGLHPDLRRHGLHRLGESLKEEAAACLLGGHGIPAHVGLAAFFAVRESGLLDRSDVSADDIYAVLSRPLDVGGRRHVHYRFARQKSIYLSGLLNGFTAPLCETNARALRDWLMRFDGVGPKTASWIVRNWLDSDQVAIIDIHVHRAGVLTGFFRPEQVVARDYTEMESQFLAFSTAIGARSSVLDALIWSQMRQANTLAIRLLRQYHEPALDATELCETGD